MTDQRDPDDDPTICGVQSPWMHTICERQPHGDLVPHTDAQGRHWWDDQTLSESTWGSNVTAELSALDWRPATLERLCTLATAIAALVAARYVVRATRALERLR